MNDWNRQSHTGDDPWDLSSKTGEGRISAPEYNASQPIAQGPEASGGYGRGGLGALLGALVGALPTLATGYFGFVSGWLALLIPFAARKGYRLLRGARRGSYAFAVILACSLVVSTGLSLFLTFPYGVMAEPVFFLLPILFSLFGALACRRGLESYVNPERMEVLAQQAQQENREIGGRGELYTAKQQWVRPLKASVLLAMFPELALAVLLLILGIPEDSMILIFASLGAIIAVFAIIFCLIFPVLGLLQPGVMVYIRSETGKLWRVALAQVNSQEPYRFTHKSGAFRVLTWERLDQAERELAKANIRRAMADIERGSILPGSFLHMALTPLEGLEVRKENRWRWKVRFRNGEGKSRTASIPKAYPGLSLIPGTPGLSGPMPFRWGLVLGAVALTMAFALAGGMVGVQMEGPAQPVRHTRAAVSTQIQI